MILDVDEILPEDDKLDIRGCLFAAPGRGDCDHFVGLPQVEDETTTDDYGRPHGWCELCWKVEQIRRLHMALFLATGHHF